MLTKHWKPMAVGVVFALIGVLAWDTGRYLVRVPQPSSVAVNRPMENFSVDPSWVKSGVPNFRAVETARSGDGKHITGLWACDGSTTFEWTFGLDETVHLLEGRVEVEYFGKHFVLEPGDTATFLAGTKATWHVPKYAKKVFKLQHPGRMVLAWRRLFPPKPDTSTAASL